RRAEPRHRRPGQAADLRDHVAPGGEGPVVDLRVERARGGARGGRPHPRPLSRAAGRRSVSRDDDARKALPDLHRRIAVMSTVEISRIGATSLKIYAMEVILLVLIAFLVIYAPGFATIGNFFNVLRTVSMLGIVAFGMTAVIISGEIDLSIG